MASDGQRIFEVTSDTHTIPEHERFVESDDLLDYFEDDEDGSIQLTNCFDSVFFNAGLTDKKTIEKDGFVFTPHQWVDPN